MGGIYNNRPLITRLGHAKLALAVSYCAIKPTLNTFGRFGRPGCSCRAECGQTQVRVARGVQMLGCRAHRRHASQLDAGTAVGHAARGCPIGGTRHHRHATAVHRPSTTLAHVSSMDAHTDSAAYGHRTSWDQPVKIKILWRGAGEPSWCGRPGEPGAYILPNQQAQYGFISRTRNNVVPISVFMGCSKDYATPFLKHAPHLLCRVYVRQATGMPLVVICLSLTVQHWRPPSTWCQQVLPRSGWISDITTKPSAITSYSGRSYIVTRRKQCTVSSAGQTSIMNYHPKVCSSHIP